MDDLTITEKLIYSTVRIECETYAGKTTGSGYFFAFKRTEVGFIPVIITNKHVIKNSIRGKIFFTKADESDNPIDTEKVDITINDFERRWIMHPDKDVDLCFLPFADILNFLEKKGEKAFFIPLETTLIPSDEQIKEFNGIEEIIMVGYPNGLWDETHNKPIFRKGITASHPKYDYNGKKEFLIDAACFPGSSGSPVFLLYEGAFTDRKGNLLGGVKFHLLGTLYAGPQHTAKGEIVITPISKLPTIMTSVPNNLGFIIKSSRILELESLV
ncbi:serine protease [Chryseobacterium sp.]|uniref:S1 family peptidase n=1 Tax=Chryseobacterium sp. TaxID=1871047 RepID=UPI002FCBC646